MEIQKWKSESRNDVTKAFKGFTSICKSHLELSRQSVSESIFIHSENIQDTGVLYMGVGT